MPATLRTDNALTDPDAFYAALIAAHDGLSDEQSAALDARLILLLANQVGDLDVLRQALAAARAALDADQAAPVPGAALHDAGRTRGPGTG